MHKSKYSQTELLQGILEDDLKTLKYIYSSCFPVIHRMVINNSGDDHDARDVFQEALIIIYRKLKENSLQLSCSFNTYLYSLCRHNWLNQLRRKGNMESIVNEADEPYTIEPEIFEEIERNERLKLYRRKFQELSDDCKQVIRMFLNNVPLKEVTKQMGYRSEQYTKNKRFRCKMALIKKIQTSKTYTELNHENEKKNFGLSRQ